MDIQEPVDALLRLTGGLNGSFKVDVMPVTQRRVQRSKMSSSETGSSGSGKREAAHRGFKRFGRYVDGSLLGQGGMGAVYKALDEELDRLVAIKILQPDKAQNPQLIKRFKSEGKAAAQLDHPNIVRVYDRGEIDGHLFIAMEFVEGIDCAELVAERGPLSAEKSLDVIKQVVAALAHAYERHIVHRDIKPSNLLVNKKTGVTKLADMGLARSLDEEECASITRAGTTVGTVDYMSPEQARDSKLADFRSDIYSLGATWYFLLVGKPPFTDGDLLNKLNAHAHADRPDPRKVNSDISPSLVSILHRMMEIKPEHRYQTPDELIDALERVNPEEREINMSVIASLEEDSQDAPAPKKRSTKRSAAANDDESEMVLKSSPKRGAGGNRPAKPEAKTAERPAPKRGERPRAKDAETMADRSTKTRSVPAVRDDDDSSPTLARRSHRQLNVEFDKTKLIMIVVAVVIGLFGVQFALSTLKSTQASLNNPGPSLITPRTEATPVEPVRTNRPQKTGN